MLWPMKLFQVFEQLDRLPVCCDRSLREETTNTMMFFASKFLDEDEEIRLFQEKNEKARKFSIRQALFCSFYFSSRSVLWTDEFSVLFIIVGNFRLWLHVERTNIDSSTESGNIGLWRSFSDEPTINRVEFRFVYSLSAKIGRRSRCKHFWIGIELDEMKRRKEYLSVLFSSFPVDKQCFQRFNESERRISENVWVHRSNTERRSPWPRKARPFSRPNRISECDLLISDSKERNDSEKRVFHCRTWSTSCSCRAEWQ